MTDVVYRPVRNIQKRSYRGIRVRRGVKRRSCYTRRNRVTRPKLQ